MSTVETPPVVQSRRASGTTTAAVLLIVLAASVYIAWPWISGAYTVPWDAKAHFFAHFQFLAGSIGAGESPFWNPYIFSGWPQIADPQSMIFVPPFLITALFDKAPNFAVMDGLVFGVLMLGGFALVIYFRDRGWHPAGAAVAALAFAFGGSAAWRIQHTGQVVSLALLPIVMVLLQRALERRSIAYGLAAGIMAGFLALGRDQIALLGIYLLIAMTITHLFSGGTPLQRMRDVIKPLAAGAIGGLAVIIVPIALTLLLAEESNRPFIDFIGAGRGSLHPASLITAVISDLFGQGAQDVHFWGPPSMAFGVTDIYLAQNMGAIYAGAIPIVAILFLGIVRGGLWVPGIRLFTVATVLTIIYAIGWYTPIFKLLFDYLPGVKLYRRPADATFIIGFQIAFLGGYLVHRWLSGSIKPTGRMTRIAEWILAALVLIVVPVAFAIHADRLPEAARPMGLAIASVAGAIVVLWLARLAARRFALAAVALVAAFTAVDLAVNNAPNESTAYPSSYYDGLRVDTTDPTVTFLKARVAENPTGDRRDRVELTGLGFHWPNASMIHRLDNVLGYNPLRFKTYQLATGAHDHVAIPEQREFSTLFPSYSSTMANLLGLRWIASSVPLTTIDPKIDQSRIVEAAVFGNTRIYENKDAFPRVLFVDQARQADFARLLETGRWPDGFDPKREVVLENAPPTSAPAAAGAPGKVTIAAYHHTAIDLVVEAERPGWVVLNDVWHRWWRVTVDGKPAEILKANGIFRAVRVDAGRHEIRYTFHPFAGALAQILGKFGA